MKFYFRRKVFVALFVVITTVMIPSLAYAEENPEQYYGSSTFEHIVDFSSDVLVRKDGSIHVTETIRYDFGSTDKHGIFRYIPYEYPWDGAQPKDAVAGSKYVRVTPLSVIRVERDGEKEKFEESVEAGNKVLKIGKGNVEISGKHTYEIEYTLENFINKFDEHDELNFNVNGNGWALMTSHVGARVRIEGLEDYSNVRMACFHGENRSTLACDTAPFIDDSEIVFDQNALSVYEGITIVVGVDKGVLAPEKPALKEKWTLASSFRITPATLIGFGGALVISFLLLMFLLYRKARDKRFVGSAIDAAFGNATGIEEPNALVNKPANPVEFVPPENVRPGQIGVLIDEKVDNVDITATIVDLAVRGYIQIGERQVEHTTMFGNDKTRSFYWVSKKKEYSDDQTLLPYERKILAALFSTKDSFYLSEMTTSQGEDFFDVVSTMYDDVVRMKWYRRRPDRTRGFWSALSWMSLLAAIGIVILLAWKTHFAFSALALIVTACIFIGLHKRMPSRTGVGTAMVGRVAGFRQIFDVGEGERQAFAEKANLFLEYLPYAIVFGCADKWANVFESLGFTQEQLGVSNFYAGTSQFSPTGFAYTMGAFSHATTGSIGSAQAAYSSSMSSSSSGFSGGGSSGGGGGGGGGGSW